MNEQVKDSMVPANRREPSRDQSAEPLPTRDELIAEIRAERWWLAPVPWSVRRWFE